MSLDRLRGLFKGHNGTTLAPDGRVQDGQGELQQPIMADSRGVLVRVPTGDEIPQKVLEAVAWDLGWSENVKLSARFIGRHGSAGPPNYVLLDDGASPATILVISRDPVAVTYCVPWHPSHPDHPRNRGEMKRFTGMDVGKDGDMTAVTISSKDGVHTVEDVEHIKAEDVVEHFHEAAKEAGITIVEASESFKTLGAVFAKTANDAAEHIRKTTGELFLDAAKSPSKLLRSKPDED